MFKIVSMCFSLKKKIGSDWVIAPVSNQIEDRAGLRGLLGEFQFFQ